MELGLKKYTTLNHCLLKMQYYYSTWCVCRSEDDLSKMRMYIAEDVSIMFANVGTARSDQTEN